MSYLTKCARIYHTIRHLKPVQIYGRFRRQLYHPLPNFGPAPPLRDLSGVWKMPVVKMQSMRGPQTFDLLNQTHSLESPEDWNNSGWSDLWLYNLHYFDDLNATGSLHRRDWHRDLIDRWVTENPPAQGVGWEPYPISIRIVNWIKWVLSGASLTDKAIHSLAVQARFLAQNLEIHLQGNHLIANAKALIFVGAFFESREASYWLKSGLDILEKQLPEQILGDGGHFELSPMYHSVVLEDILDLCNLFHAYPKAFNASDCLLGYWEQIAQRMRKWLKVMCHPDGDIALFNDAALNTVASPGALDAYARRLGLRSVAEPGDGITHLSDSGYIRVQQNEMVALLDVGRIGPDYLPGHAHADTLTFELSLFGDRVIVDAGTSTYTEGEERHFQRSTMAHNTVVVDGKNSSDMWGGFRVARRAYPIDLSIEDRDRSIIITCGHDGYRRLPGRVIHKRSWVFGQRSLEIKDLFEGAFSASVAYFHLHPDVRVNQMQNEDYLALNVANRDVDWRTWNTSVEVREGSYHPGFGVSLDNLCLAAEMKEGSAHMLTNHLSWDAI